MAELAPELGAVLEAIRKRGYVTAELDRIVAAHGSEPVEALLAAGLIVRWEAPGGTRLAFTPIAVVRLGLSLAERVEHTTEQRWRNGKLERRSVPTEEPFWIGAGDEAGSWGVKIKGDKRYGVVQPPEAGPWTEVPDPSARPAAKRREPVHLMDEVSGQPLRVFVGPKRPEPAPAARPGGKDRPPLAGGIGKGPWEPGLKIEVDPKRWGGPDESRGPGRRRKKKPPRP